MAANYKWYGNEVKRHLRGSIETRLEKAAILVKNAVKEELSASYPPAAGAGELPHKRSGRLRASISHEVDKERLTARVGTNVIYGKFLEIGTRLMAARPFLQPTFEKMQDAIKTLLAGEIK